MNARRTAGAENGMEGNGEENNGGPKRAPGKEKAPVMKGEEFVSEAGIIFAAMQNHPQKRRWWPLALYRVAGESMLPVFQPGDTLIGWRWFHPRPGQVVVARRERPLIKRIARIADGQVWLLGDNPPKSTDSRHFGPVHLAQIEALILARLP